MERSKATIPKYNFKLDLEAVTKKELREPLMKYKTMGEKEEEKHIDGDLAYSDFESSDEIASDNNNKVPTTGINSESGLISEKTYPKLLKLTPRRKTHTEHQYDKKYSPRLNYSSSSIFFNKGKGNNYSESEISEDDLRSVRSLKSRKDMQIESLKAMAPIVFKIMVLLMSCIAASCAPALLIQLPGNNMLTLVVWKLQITLLVTSILAFFELKNLKRQELSLRPRAIRKVIYMMIAGFMYVVWLVGLLEAFKNSIVLHALILNSLGIFIGPICSFILCRGVNYGKMIAVMVGIAGVLLMLKATYNGSCHLADGSSTDIKYDLFNIASSVAGYIYFNRIEVLNKSVPSFTLMTITTFFSIIFAFLFMGLKMPFDGINPFTLNIETGVFGWVNNVGLTMQCLLVIGVIGSLCGNFGYIYSLKFWSSTTVSNVLYSEPLMGQYIAVYVFQINQAPPTISILGGLVVILGMYICREAQLGSFTRKPKREIKVEKCVTELEAKPYKAYMPQKSF